MPSAERRRVGLDRALVVAVGLGHRDREADGLGGRDVAERAALQAREDRAVDLLRELLAAEDEARARAGERLVRGRADDVGRLDGVLVQARRDEAREVRHVDHQQRPGLVGDLAERARVDLARVGRAARHDQLRPVLEREGAHLVEVDAPVLAAHRVAVELVVAAREVDLEAVREVAAVVEAQPQHGVARVEHGVVGRHVRAGARVRLDVRVLGAEERLGALDRERLDLVHDLAAAVVALAGQALGVLVGEHRADGLEHGGPGEVLGRDQLELVALARELGVAEAGDLGVDLGEAETAQVVERVRHVGSFRDGIRR